MNQLKKLLDGLLNTFKLTSTASNIIPEITQVGHNQEHVTHILNLLLKEGDIHLSGHWAAHMTPETSDVSIIGQVIAARHNGNLLSPQLYPVLSQIERQTMDYLCQLFNQQYGHFVAGSSYANLEALWQAKLNSSTSSRIIYAARSVHFSIVKACQILDLELRYITNNEYDQLSIEALELACQQQAPLAIVATIGTTAMGAIDPVSECITIAQNYDAWCHIDAAWGGALVLLPEHSSLFELMSQVDSICFDPHKAWQQPKPASVLLYKQPLTPMLPADSSYLEQTPLNNLPGSRGGELFLPLWLTLIHSGSDSLRTYTQKRLEQATRFAMQLKSLSNWVIYPSHTGIICFKPDKIIDLSSLIEQGVLSQTRINNTRVYRAVFASSHTSAESIIEVLQPYF